MGVGTRRVRSSGRLGPSPSRTTAPTAPFGQALDEARASLKRADDAIQAGLAADLRIALLEAIISIGRQPGLDLIAEGIETDEMLDSLRRLGCNAGRGYLLARPALPETIKGRLVEQRQAGSAASGH